jgi:outer membrane protein assembly factor BamE (lipoprotein component of BamABCDE complex)
MRKRLHIHSTYGRPAAPRLTMHAAAGLSMLCACLLLAGCSSIRRVDDAGFRDADISYSELKEGASTKDDVRAALGTPSTKSDFGPETWYYVSLTKMSEAFFAPEITHQKVTAIQFSDAGVVQKITHYGLDQSKNLQIVDDVTPTEGHKLSVIEQIVGNLGRFNKSDDASGTVAPHKTH